MEWGWALPPFGKCSKLRDFWQKVHRLPYFGELIFSRGNWSILMLSDHFWGGEFWLCVLFSSIRILGKTLPKAMEWGWAHPCTENVHSFVTFPYGWLPWVVLRDFSQCRLHPLLLESKKNHRILFTGHWTFFKRHLRGQRWSHCWFWCRWRFRPFLSGVGSNIHWALHPPICQCKGCYHKKKVEEEHRQPHRWNRDAISTQL